MFYFSVFLHMIRVSVFAIILKYLSTVCTFQWLMQGRLHLRNNEVNRSEEVNSYKYLH